VPNIQLNNLWIENVSRSKAMKEVIDINVSYDTSFEDLELLRLEMEKFVQDPENARDFQPDIAISVAGVGDLDKLQLKMAIKHKSNWHNDAVRATRRSKFMCALTLALKKVPIYNPGGGNEALGAPGNPSYSVAVSDEMAAANRAKASKDKEGKRMVPSKSNPVRSDSSSSKTQTNERQAAQDLNARSPVAEAFEEWGTTRDADDRRRSNDLRPARIDMSKRESQRGRRRAGETLPPSALANASGAQTGQLSPRHRTFDEEAQTGAVAMNQGSGYGNLTQVVSSQSNYSIFPQARNYSPPTSSSNNFSNLQGTQQGGNPHPLQSAPIPSTQAGRARGLSVSRTQQGPPGQKQ
jgi:hypothetical protein